MKSAIINRILIVLGVIGVFIAGVLSMQHLLQIEIPCTTGGGCDVVARHASSYIPITIGNMAGIPVAYLGFFGYILLTLVAIYRSATGTYTSSKFVGIGFFLAAVGMLYSLYLQYVSFTEIHAVCVWCMSSAVVMILTFIGHVLLLNETNNEATTDVPRISTDLIIGAVGLGVALLGVGLTVMGQQKINIKIEVVKVDNMKSLIPDVRNQVGKDDAPVTIVEFADLCCPACRTSFSKIREIRKKYGDKIRFVYRHFPLDRLPGHESTLMASVASEAAADEGKFWQFAEAFVATPEPVKTEEEIVAMAVGVGVNKKDLIAAMKDVDSGPSKRVIRDFEDAVGTFKLTGTPQFMLYIKGEPVRKLNGAALMAELDKPEVQKYLK